MNKQDQLAVVKKALNLTQGIQEQRRKISSINNEQFERVIPAKPEKKVPQTRSYKYFKPDMKYHESIRLAVNLSPLILLGLAVFLYALTTIIQSTDARRALVTLAILAGISYPVVQILVTVIYENLFYKPAEHAAIEEIQKSAEYIQDRQEVDAFNAKAAQDAEDEYETRLKEYNEVTIPRLKAEFRAWDEDRNQRLGDAEEVLEEFSKQLEQHYKDTGIIPEQYRSVDSLTYLYKLMSTSDYDIKEAISMYNNAVLRQLEINRITEQQRANALLDEQNALLDEQNEIADRARREANIAAVVSAVQRHNANKRR